MDRTMTRQFLNPLLLAVFLAAVQLSAARGAYLPGAPQPNPNLLVNPGMGIDQINEGASASLTAGNGQTCVDGWKALFISSTASGLTCQRVTDAPAGIGNSIKLTVGTGASSVASADKLQFYQVIEANFITGLAAGTPSAVTVSISFWVKSSIGSYTANGAVLNDAATRSYPFNFSIPSANTWTQIQLSFAWDTAGTWVNSGTGVGAYLIISPAVGSNRQGTANTWNAGVDLQGTSANTNTILTTNGATFQITGVKLEISPVPTPFRSRDPMAEMALDQRYFEKSYAQGTTVGTATSTSSVTVPLWGTTNATYYYSVAYKTTKRCSPTITLYSSGTGASGKWSVNSSDVSASVGNVGDSVTLVQSTFTPTIGGAWQGHWTADCQL